MTLVEKAEAIARKAHDGQFRRDGVTPYITHPERVVARLRAQGVTDKETLAMGWLHDVLEDATEDIITEMIEQLPSNIRSGVKLLTRDTGEDYFDSYLHWINQTHDTRIVKIADILDNLSDAPTERQIVKYSKALLYLHGKNP